jgi:uncharacterized membrane-anchored protein YhcB (DUF1043 family)
MEEKDLKKLSRLQLLELFVQKSKELDDLAVKLDFVQNELNQRDAICSNAKTLAKAVFDYNKVYEICKQSADDYLANIQGGEKQHDAG